MSRVSLLDSANISDGRDDPVVELGLKGVPA